ncbi:MAG TPA: DNA polymerase IV [Candidatus Thermoplasmatota archaeon]|nr:DNA polymerase IV [Candidatus Thermoplasmatota archaeon]
MGDRIVAHLDMDAFFASCEERRHPELKGKPVVVGAPPRDGRGRGVVVAANYAARAFGIRSAMPIGEAWRRKPDAHFLSPDHSFYSSISKSIFTDLRASFPVEQVSVDEGYLDATPFAGWAEAEAFAATIHGRVERATGGLTCSVGLAPNKLVAKIASDYRKPNGTTLVRPADIQSFLDPLPVRKVPGIGPKTSERLAEIDVHTIKQLRTTERANLLATFGSHGAFMWDAAHGRDDSNVRSEWEPHKSISEEHTFGHDTRDRRILLRSLRSMVASLEEDLVRRDYWFKSVALKLRFADFETHTKQASLGRHVGDTTTARRILPRLLDEFLEDRREVRLIGVRFGDLLKNLGQRTLATFPTGQSDSQKPVASAA